MPNLPTPSEIQALYEKYHTPPHVRAHCAAVARFAAHIGTQLKENGLALDIELIMVAGALHDLVRIVDFKQFDPAKFPQTPSEADIRVWTALREEYRGVHHSDAAAKILQSRYPELAVVIAKHKFLQIEIGFDTWEEKILYYADKRVQHDRIVPLQERLTDGRKRNAPEMIGTPESKALDQKVFALEQDIRTHAINPDF